MWSCIILTNSNLNSDHKHDMKDNFPMTKINSILVLQSLILKIMNLQTNKLCIKTLWSEILQLDQLFHELL